MSGYICYLAPVVQVGPLSNAQQARFASIAYEQGLGDAMAYLARVNGFPMPTLAFQPERGDVSESSFAQWQVIVGDYDWAGLIGFVYHEVCHLYQVFELAKSFIAEGNLEGIRGVFPDDVIEFAKSASKRGLADPRLLEGWRDSFTNPAYAEAGERVVTLERFSDEWYAANAIYVSQSAEAEAYWAQAAVEYYLSSRTNPPAWWTP
jgi:hypothetical protein